MQGLLLLYLKKKISNSQILDEFACEKYWVMSSVQQELLLLPASVGVALSLSASARVIGVRGRTVGL